MRHVLLLSSLIGLLLFGAVFTLAWLSPISIERAAQSFIRYKVEEKAGEAIDKAVPDRFQAAAKLLASRYDKELATIREQMRSGLSEKVASVVASMQDADCTCRRWLAAKQDQALNERIQWLGRAKTQLTELVQSQYARVVQGLLRDLRIFSGSNALAFALVLGIAIGKPRATGHLVLPGMLLLVATLVSSGFYLFGQDWFWNILMNSFMGFAYLFWLAIVFGFLCDIALNRGRVTAEIANAIANAVGNATVSFGPC